MQPSAYAPAWPSYSSPYPTYQPQQPLPQPVAPAPPLPPTLTVDEQRIARLRELEVSFSKGLLHGVLPKTYGVVHTGRPSRAAFTWGGDSISDGDRAQVVVNCMRRVGVESIGDLLKLLFRKQPFSEHDSVARAVNFFVSGRSIFPAERPEAIIFDLIYPHPHATVPNAPPPSFDLPRHALPPTQRMGPPVENGRRTTTRNAMLNRCVQLSLIQIDEESTGLLTWQAILRPPGTRITWSSMLSWDMHGAQEYLAVNAPVLFASMSTAAVSPSARKKLVNAADATTAADATDAATAADAAEDGTDPDRARRDPWLAVTVFILALLHFRYRYAILFPTIIGIFLFTCNTHRDVMNLLCRIGISISYAAVLDALHTLADDAGAQLRALGEKLKDLPPFFQMVFDNVNKMARSWQQKLGTKDEVHSGTAATLVMLKAGTMYAGSPEKLMETRKEGGRADLTVEKLLEDINHAHLAGIGKATVMRTWLKHLPALTRFRAQVEDLFTTTYAIRRIRPEVSEIHTMRTTNIDESTTIGVHKVLLNLITLQLAAVRDSVAKWVMMIAGDQLTVDRIRKLKRYLKKGEPGFGRFQWVLPTIQLWHLKWNWQKAIFRMHWWPQTGRNIYGLHHDVNILGREKFNPDRGDFYPSHAILEDRFDTMLLDILRILCEERTGLVYPESMPLLDLLQAYFTGDGALAECTYDDLSDLADKTYCRYMCSRAWEASLGHVDRREDIYGPQVDPVDHADNDTQQHGQESAPKKAKRKNTKKGKTKETENKAQGDQVLANSIAYLRSVFWYLELCAAISEGDIGRVFEVLKVLRFSFWGTGSTNYANELLELACNFLYEYPEALILSILDNYLVNITGKLGRFSELDLLQEHHNFLIKRLFNSKSFLFDSKHVAETIGLNIRGFKSIRDLMPVWMGFKRNSYSHPKPEKSADINKLGATYRKYSLLSYLIGRAECYLVQDEFAVGLEILEGGKLREFIDRTIALFA
ncbi:hypothetical protein BDZ89DRAFT_963282 [Hymenopellis radicata]|nr:hypothetical protein BDZ89DRAFT_963282 [Hymenopellis radicata]